MDVELRLTVESKESVEEYAGLPERQLERIEEEVITGLVEEGFQFDEVWQTWKHKDGREVEVLWREAVEAVEVEPER